MLHSARRIDLRLAPQQGCISRWRILVSTFKTDLTSTTLVGIKSSASRYPLPDEEPSRSNRGAGCTSTEALWEQVIHLDLLPPSLMISAPVFVLRNRNNVLFIKLVSEHDNLIYCFHLAPKIPVKHKVCKKSFPNKSRHQVNMQSISSKWKSGTGSTVKQLHSKVASLTFNKQD